LLHWSGVLPGLPYFPTRRSSDLLLRAESKTYFDELLRVYRTEAYSVDPSTGSMSANSLRTDLWFDRRGNLVKTAAPGGLVGKAADRKSTRLNSSHLGISYAVFCL